MFRSYLIYTHISFTDAAAKTFDFMLITLISAPYLSYYERTRAYLMFASLPRRGTVSIFLAAAWVRAFHDLQLLSAGDIFTPRSLLRRAMFRFRHDFHFFLVSEKPPIVFIYIIFLRHFHIFFVLLFIYWVFICFVFSSLFHWYISYYLSCLYYDVSSISLIS